MCLLLMVCVSQCPRHSDSKVQIMNCAQAQYIGKIVCVAGNEIDQEVSTTHDGMLSSSFK